MRKLGLIFFLVLLVSLFRAGAQMDSTRLSALEGRLSEYFALLESEPSGVKIEECDALIGAAMDSSLRQTIALKIYDHYRNSPLMGEETVAIHLIDRWFSSGEIAMRSERDLFDARLFADSNRQSLLGMAAPPIDLLSPEGDTVRVEFPLDSEPDVAVLYFFDSSCAKCKLETATLRSLLNERDYPLTVYAIYVGSDADAWLQWREKAFRLDASRTRVIHLWDPYMESDIQSKYGVLSTPRMFLVGSDGTILGRGLDTEALQTLADAVLADDEYSYGSEAAFDFLGHLFSLYGSDLASEDVMDVARLLREGTLDRRDTLSFKHLEGDLLYWLASRREEPFREGTLPFIEEYVLGAPDIWNTPEDSLMVIGMAQMLKGLLEKSPVGSRIPKMRVKGWNSFRRKGGYIFFHVSGCSVCEEQMALADSLGLRYLSVDMDSLEEKSPKVFRRLLDTFDLSALPFVMEIGKGGVVKRRYVSLDKRLLFLDEKN